MSGDALVLRGDAFTIPLRDKSVSVVITSPPFFGQRSYTDGGVHYDGQIGGEPTPQEFLTALFGVMREVWRVLADDGVVFVNLGDKRSGSGAPGTTSGLGKQIQGDRFGGSSVINGRQGQHEQRGVRTAAYTKAAFGRSKSKQLIPERFAIGCADGLADPNGIGWIVRHDIVWEKPNGMPESVRDRPRDNIEHWYMLTKQESYGSSIDEIRVPHKPGTAERYAQGYGDRSDYNEKRLGVGLGAGGGMDLGGDAWAVNPLGKLPGSVWTIATEPLSIPDRLNVEHFAAFPSEWPRRLILGFAPNGICTVCGRGRRPVTETSSTGRQRGDESTTRATRGLPGYMDGQRSHFNEGVAATIIGYVCACTPSTDNRGKRGNDWRADRTESAEHLNEFDTGSGNNVPRRPGGFGTKIPPPATPIREYHLDGWSAPPTRPAVILDPFGGTGTTAMVARALGHTGISLDLSYDYCRVARWRIWESGHGAKIESRTNADRQTALF